MPLILSADEIMAVTRERPSMIGTAFAALNGDEVAEAGLCDFIELEGLMESPFEIGQGYLIQTNTLYYTGRVSKIGFGWIIIKDASWVHWTGRLSTLLRRMSFLHNGWPASERKPRTERCGPKGVIIYTQNIVSAHYFDGELPTESIS